ncbi:MAG: hypothetical protein J5863_02800 [Desulfovibrio sp.]|nr:hypothetical protein [Desulfovibrio sp.]
MNHWKNKKYYIYYQTMVCKMFTNYECNNNLDKQKIINKSLNIIERSKKFTRCYLFHLDEFSKANQLSEKYINELRYGTRKWDNDSENNIRQICSSIRRITSPLIRFAIFDTNLCLLLFIISICILINEYLFRYYNILDNACSLKYTINLSIVFIAVYIDLAIPVLKCDDIEKAIKAKISVITIILVCIFMCSITCVDYSRRLSEVDGMIIMSIFLIIYYIKEIYKKIYSTIDNLIIDYLQYIESIYNK